MAEKKYTTNIRLEYQTALKLKFIASMDNRSINNYIELLIKKEISKYELENGKIPIS